MIESVSDSAGTPPLPDPVMPSSSAMRRALRRARDGATINVDEAAVLLAARGDDLAELCATAARIRDTASVDADGNPMPPRISYSRSVFIPLTRLCRDRCHYCTFVTVPGKLAREGKGMFLEMDEVLDIARRGAEMGCKEALFTLGDRPEDRWPEAAQWLDERGYDSTLDYLRAASIRVLEETGLLPHLNPGVQSWEEMSRLKPVSPSMGMMLETTSSRLFTEKGQCHYGSPDKDPEIRKRVLVDAGRLSVPFTTGILVGIGETLAERAESLMEIRKVHKAFGHIQEVIMQNFRAKDDTAMRATPDAGFEEFLAAVAVARVLLGPKMHIQAPPNLVSHSECRALLGAGIDDWGGVSPLTAGSCESGTSLAEPRYSRRDHRVGRLRAGRADGGTRRVRAGRSAVDRSADHHPCPGIDRSRDRPGSAGRRDRRASMAGAR
jgi:FO synthase